MKKKTIRSCLLGLWLAVGLAQGQSAAFLGLGVPSGATRTVATQISADGSTAVGTVVNAHEGLSCEEYDKEAALYWSVTGGLVRLSLPTNALLQRALGVSGNGGVVVGELVTTFPDGTAELSEDSIEGAIKPFRWSAAGALEWLAIPAGSLKTSAVAVSADGSTVVGSMDGEDGYEACRWTAAGLEPLGFFPDGIESRALAVSSNGSVVVGYGHHLDGIRAFRWTAAGGLLNLGVLPGGRISRAAGVSADGDVVVGVVEGGAGAPNKQRAFRWTAGQGMLELAPPADVNDITAMAVSANGGVAVGFMGGPGWREAFVWTATNGVRNIKSVLADAGVATGPWHLEMAMGISADGRTVVGTGINTNLQCEAWRAILP